jgi:hypothetical protein
MHNDLILPTGEQDAGKAQEVPLVLIDPRPHCGWDIVSRRLRFVASSQIRELSQLGHRFP